MADDTAADQAATRARLTMLRANRAAREAKFDDTLEIRALAILELDEKLSSTYGTRGEDYEIVDCGSHGPIGLKLGEAVLYKKYRAKVRADKDTQEDLIAWVRPCVIHPDLPTFDEITGKHGHILDKCGNALLRLYGGWEDRSQGKS